MAGPMRIEWSEADYLQGAEILLYALNTHKAPRIVLSAGDAFRAVMVGLWEAELMMQAALFKAGGFDPGEVMKTAPVVDVGNRRLIGTNPDVVKRFGQGPLLAYQASQRCAREMVRASRFVSTLPVLGGGPPPRVVEDAGPTKHTIAPLVVVVIGLVAVAALAAGAYVIKEYHRSSAEVETEKVRVQAEMALKQQAISAQIAAGQKPDLSKLVITKGGEEETSRWLVPVGLGAGAAGVIGGAALWQRKRP